LALEDPELNTCKLPGQLPPRRLHRLTHSLGDCLRNPDPRADPLRLDSDHRHLLGTFAEQHGRLEQLGYIAFMRGGSELPGVLPTAQNVNGSRLRSQRHGVQNQQRAAVGDAVEQRQPLRTPIIGQDHISRVETQGWRHPIPL